MCDLCSTIIIAILGILLVAQFVQGHQIRQIRRALHQSRPKHDRVDATTPSCENSTLPAPQTDFEQFLAEDSTRLSLGKKEQAAAFRAWRKQRGLTWNG